MKHLKNLPCWIILSAQALGIMLVLYLIADGILSHRQFSPGERIYYRMPD